MKHVSNPLVPFLLVALAGLQAPASAQCGADGEIPDRATLDAILGGNQVLEDFESFAVGVGGAVNLDTFILDSTTIANGQGPGLVEPGATYVDPSSIQLQWNGDQYFNRTTKTILANGSTGAIHILYSPAIQAMGVDLSGFDGFGYSGTMDVYAAGNVLVGTVAFNVGGGPNRDFAGWQHLAGIERVEISSGNWPWSPKIDDHGYGNCNGGGGGTFTYCDPSDGHPNNAATISASGVSLATTITIDLAGGPDGQFGYLLIGDGTGIVTPPASKGELCLLGGACLGRYAKDVATISGGMISTDIENSLSGGANYGIPTCGGNITSGQTWHFQYWHRQPMGQPSTFSQALGVTFTN